MRKTERQTVTEEREIVTDCLCNCCGQSCIPEEAKASGVLDCYGLIGARFSPGHFSTHFTDDESVYSFDVCEACLSKWFETFQHQPLRTGGFFGLDEPGDE